jgi:Putative membrane protein insertion efficiency factor
VGPETDPAADLPTDPATDLTTAERRRRKRQQRKRRRKDEDDREDAVSDALDGVEAASEAGGGCSDLSGCGRGRGGGRGGTDTGCGSGGSGGRGGGGGCDGCDGPCDFTLLRLSTMLLVAAALAPERPAGRRLVRALVRGYQRWLTRFTPRCPSTPSCSAFALAAVDSLGARRGLAAAAERIRRCGTA